MNPAEALSLVRRHARREGLRVLQLAKRGKGSHQIYALPDSSGEEVVRFGLTRHARDLSWEVLRALEERLAPWFGEKWTER